MSSPPPSDPRSGSVPGIPTGPGELPELSKTVELVREFRRGDTSALNELFRRYQPRLRRVIRIRMGARLRQYLDPEDILQETCLVALEKLSDFEMRNQASVMQWLTKIAEFQIKNKVSYLRAQKRDPERERRLRESDPASESSSGVVVPHTDPSPSQITLRSELEEIIDGCVETLEPDDYREVILMRDYFGAEWEAIRRHLNRPTADAVRELHRRAHEKLLEKLRSRGIS